MTGSDFSHLAGPLLLGYMLNWGLFGVLTVQVYVYWIAFPNDRLSTQILVYGIFVLETAQTLSLTHDGFQQFVIGFTNPESVDNSQLEWLNTCIFDGLVALVFQLFFANRIRVLLPEKKVIPGTIVLLSLAQTSGAIATGISYKTATAHSFSDLPANPVSAFFWMACTLMADVLIAGTMIYALSRYDTTFREAASLVKRLKLLAIETGSLIAATNLLTVLLYPIRPDRIYFLTPALFVAKMYSNSLLAVLNARVQIDATSSHRDTRSNGSTRRRSVTVNFAPTVMMTRGNIFSSNTNNSSGNRTTGYTNGLSTNSTPREFSINM